MTTLDAPPIPVAPAVPAAPQLEQVQSLHRKLRFLTKQ